MSKPLTIVTATGLLLLLGFSTTLAHVEIQEPSNSSPFLSASAFSHVDSSSTNWRMRDQDLTLIARSDIRREDRRVDRRQDRLADRNVDRRTDRRGDRRMDRHTD